MSNIFKGFFISSLALLSLTFVSCGDDDEDIEATPEFIENLPSAENIKATTAFIPINTSDIKGDVFIYYGIEKYISELPGMTESFSFYTVTYLTPGESGILITDLKPEHSYYYKIVYYPYNSKDPVFSKQYKSFTTTNDVSIQFTEPATIPMGNWSDYALRFKTSGIEEWDVPSNLQVALYSAFYNEDSDNIGICSIKYSEDGVWQHDFPIENQCYMAVIKNTEGHIYAKTPIVRLVDGKMIEVEDNHSFDSILND